MNARGQLRAALDAIAPESGGVWSSTPRFPKGYERIKAFKPVVMTIANLKGGVGKTTVAANLAACYAIRYKERVLVIDLDFQGSISSMLFNGQNPAAANANEDSKASRLIEQGTGEWLRGNAIPVHLPFNSGASLSAITGFYDLARTENRVMIRWLLGEYQRGPLARSHSDVRYWLARTLLSPEIQANFDRVIIDAPPRFLTGCVQALCASQYVLIPTVLDKLSSEAAIQFLGQLAENQKLWPNLKVAGIVATMTSPNLSSVTEKDTIRFLIRTMEKSGHGQLLGADAIIPDRPILSRAAGQGIVYSEKSEDKEHAFIRERFDCLAAAIDRVTKGEETHETWKTWLVDSRVNAAAS